YKTCCTSDDGITTKTPTREQEGKYCDECIGGTLKDGFKWRTKECCNQKDGSPVTDKPDNKCQKCTGGIDPNFTWGDKYTSDEIAQKAKECKECCPDPSNPEIWIDTAGKKDFKNPFCCLKQGETKGTWVDKPNPCAGTDGRSMCSEWNDEKCACLDCGEIPGTEKKKNCCEFTDEGTTTHACCEECVTKEQCDKEGKKWVKGPDDCYTCEDCDPCMKWDETTKECKPAMCKGIDETELTLKEDEADKCLECIVGTDGKSWYCDYKKNDDDTNWGLCDASKMTANEQKLKMCYICHSKDGLCTKPTDSSKPHNLSDLKTRCEESVEKMGCEPKTTDLEVGPNETISSCRAICCDEEIDGWTPGGGGGSPNPDGGVSIKGLVYLGGGGGCNCYEYELKESGKKGETCKPTTLGCTNLTKSDGTYLEEPLYGLLPALTELITRKYYRAIGKDDKEVEFDNIHKRGPRTDVTNCCPKCKEGRRTFMACEDNNKLDTAVCCGVDKELAELGGFKTETCDGVTDLPICCLDSGEKTGVRVQGKDELLGKCCPLVGGEKSGDKWKKKPIPTPAFWDGSSAQCCTDSQLGKKIMSSNLSEEKKAEALGTMIVVEVRSIKDCKQIDDKYTCAVPGTEACYDVGGEEVCCPGGTVACKAISGGGWTCCPGTCETLKDIEASTKKTKLEKSLAFKGDGEMVCRFFGFRIEPGDFWYFLCRWGIAREKWEVVHTADEEKGCHACYVEGDKEMCCSDVAGSYGDAGVTLKGDPKAKYTCCNMDATDAYWHTWNLWDWLNQVFLNIFTGGDKASCRECCKEPEKATEVQLSDRENDPTGGKETVYKCCETDNAYANSTTLWSLLRIVGVAADGECCEKEENLVIAKASGVDMKDKVMRACCPETKVAYINPPKVWEILKITTQNDATCCTTEKPSLIEADTSFLAEKNTKYYTCCATDENRAYAAPNSIWDNILNFFGIGDANSNVKCCKPDTKWTEKVTTLDVE
ncbi:MAG: hypothetical protein J6U64_03935, partial [Alphaproteobacteria bacterium]|nr:hypothetical protein [Alphaproteobacteria bacterium]